MSRDRRRPRHERGGKAGKVVPLFTGQDTTTAAARLIRFTDGQLDLLTEALADAVWARRQHPDPRGDNETQAVAYEQLAGHCGVDLDDGEDPS